MQPAEYGSLPAFLIFSDVLMKMLKLNLYRSLLILLSLSITKNPFFGRFQASLRISLKLFKQNIGCHMIVVYLPKVSFILTKNYNKISVIADQLFKNFTLRLIHIKHIDVISQAHGEIFCCCFVFRILNHQISLLNSALFLPVVRKSCYRRIVIYSFDTVQEFFQKQILRLLQRFRKKHAEPEPTRVKQKVKDRICLARI